MPLATVQDLRRIAEAVGELRDRRVTDVLLRSDCRQLRLTLENGQVVLVTVLLDGSGKPRLDVDLIRAADEAVPGQLEVRFDGGE